MGWAVGYDPTWGRDIGYGVPAVCDHPGCDKKIDRGLAYVCCDSEPYGGEYGCGLYFCGDHQSHGRCTHEFSDSLVYRPSEDTAEWIRHKLTDPSWEQWRIENADEVKHLRSVTP